MRHLLPALSFPIAALAIAGPALALPAFPGAQGFGANATGGRGGAVIRVTTLAESGPGSLREALETPGPRTIVFAVSGVIDLGEANADDPFDETDSNNVLTITHGDVTIAGQTAPGAGITIRGRLYAAYDEAVGNIILRHVRIRPAPFPGGDGGEQYDGLRIALNQLAIVDHVSVSWGVDENVDLYEGSNITVQWSEIAEAATEGHPEGDHNYGVLNYGGRTSVHHTLFAHNRNRNPALATGPSESINNVAYNVRHGFVNHNDASGEINIVGNTFVQGPDDSLIPLFFDGGESVSYWLADNCVDDPRDYTGCVDDPWAEAYFAELIGAADSVRAGAAFDFAGADYEAVDVQAASEAYDAVLDCAGAFPHDVVSTTLRQEIADRSGSWGGDQPADLMAGLQAVDPPADADEDGMADAWEREHGLDPADGSDHATVMPSGYTAIEDYLDELAQALACGGTPGDTDGDDDGGNDDGDTNDGGGVDSTGAPGDGSADGGPGSDGGSASASASNGGSASVTAGDESGTSSAAADGTTMTCSCTSTDRSAWPWFSAMLVALGLRRRRVA